MKQIVTAMFTAGVFALATQVYAADNATANTAANNIDVSPAEKTKIESVVHQYLLQKPEVLIEAMQVLQRKQYEQTEQTIKQTQQIAPSFANALLHQGNDPIGGNSNGKITIVEFFDYQCPHCIDMAPVMDAIIKVNPDLRVVYKEFPIRGPMSDLAAQAALAANKQGKYSAFSHALLTANRPLTQDLIYQIAKNTGLNVDQLKKDMQDGSISDQLKSNLKLAQDLKLFGTPAFFVGKTDATTNSSLVYMPSQLNQTQLQDLINKAKQ